LGRNLELVIAYDGAGFNGWQIQPSGRTVQGILNKKLEKLLNEPVKTMGASRTDSGVHAHDQHVTLSIDNMIPLSALERSLNHHLPEDIRCLNVTERDPGFSARRSAVGKHYIYILVPDTNRNPFLGRYSLAIERRLNIEGMVKAAESFVGMNDFKSLQNSRDFRIKTIVHIHEARIVTSNDMVFFHVIGHSFLYNMVRNMLGSLLKIGFGEWNLVEFRKNLASADRTKMGITAPAQGLHLVQVFYDHDSINREVGSKTLFSHLRI